MRVVVLGLVSFATLYAATPVFDLPAGVVPRKHTLDLRIDPAQPTMEGRIEIALDLAVATGQIWLNARDITIIEATVNGAPAKASLDGGEFLGVEGGPWPAGPATLVLRFEAKVDDRVAVGAYRRKVAGDWYVYTTFTPIEARRAFPCFDEPRYKTPWNITLHVPAENQTFSNAPEQSSTVDGGWKTVHFETTPPIAAEVVAFAVGPFEILDGGVAGASKTPIRVVTAKGHSAEGTAAVQNTTMVLSRLEAYIGIPYPFGKLDQLAIPDIEFSAVENPGLITYRARNLQLPPDTDLTRSRALRLLEAHEISHQWFGNLVTQRDWNDVWLSEGFATWLSEKMMDMEQPSDRTHLAAIVLRERIMGADSPRARSVRSAVGNRAGSFDIYSRFVYDKAASVLMMLEHWIGENRFQAGLRTYLKAHPYGTATSEDLAQALAEASGTNLWPVLHSLLDSPGIPQLHGEVECEKGELTISQNTTSTLPVCWRSDIGSGCDVLQSAIKAVKLSSCPAWLYLNGGGTGYFRTTWTPAQLAQLRLNQLTAAERLTLVYDLRAQASEKTSARPVLERLARDIEPEIAQAARDALK